MGKLWTVEGSGDPIWIHSTAHFGVPSGTPSLRKGSQVIDTVAILSF
jgi:hypothetical protein